MCERGAGRERKREHKHVVGWVEKWRLIWEELEGRDRNMIKSTV